MTVDRPQDDDYNFDAENLVIAIVECLARAKYRLQISIQGREVCGCHVTLQLGYLEFLCFTLNW